MTNVGAVSFLVLVAGGVSLLYGIVYKRAGRPQGDGYDEEPMFLGARHFGVWAFKAGLLLTAVGVAGLVAAVVLAVA